MAACRQGAGGSHRVWIGETIVVDLDGGSHGMKNPATSKGGGRMMKHVKPGGTWRPMVKKLMNEFFC